MPKYPLRAVIISVDYSDLLAVTLPWNRHHFEQILVVTSNRDVDTINLVYGWHREDPNRVNWFSTDAFYERGAIFNKWAALEKALDLFGRRGWLCLKDADVLWPKEISLDLVPGKLYSPLRRMLPLTNPHLRFAHAAGPELYCFPPENQWGAYAIHRNVNEWAGYTQLFHANDPVLGAPPWHEVNWKHAGGADSFFQQKWSPANKVRPSWELLHLGEAGQNWMGRSTPLLDGGRLAQADQRRAQMNQLWIDRRGRDGPARFDHEKL